MTNFEQAEALGRKAVEVDHWMVPDEDNVEGEDKYGMDRLSREICGWTETDHYNCIWRKKLVALLPADMDEEDRIYALMDLEEAFFQTWLAGHDKKREDA